MTSDTKALKKKLLAKAAAPRVEPPSLSTGSTLLNLALAGRTDAGFARGGYYLLVGGSRSCKTFLVLTTLAEASVNPKYKRHRLVLMAPERGARMDIKRFFGAELERRLEWFYPQTVEEFYFLLDDLRKAGKPHVAGLDSMDSLVPQAELDQFKKAKAASRNGREVGGSYGTAKAKANSSGIRKATLDLAESGSILIVISQTRMNIGFGSQFSPETRSGGTSLQFYATGEVWLKIHRSIKRVVNGKARRVGTVVKASVKKNRDTGREPSVLLHHYPDVGLDDTGSLVAYLCDEGHWQCKLKDGLPVSLDAEEFDFKGPAEKLVQKVEADGKEGDLRLLAGEVWDEIESACTVKRKARYA